MEKYKIGIIGYGGFGRFLHHWWGKMDNVEVVAVADSGTHYTHAQTCRHYHDWRELISDPSIDIVSIVTPPGLHAEIACEAMKAGKHVLLEKPVAVSEEDAHSILEVQWQTGRIITVDHMIRYNPIIQTFIQLGNGGALGKLRHVVVNNYAQDASLPADHWFWNEEVSGGILVEHGVHFFDIVKALSGQRYREVFGCSDSRNAAQCDRVASMVLYDDGLIASYYHAFSGPGFFEKTTIHLSYDLARIEIEGWMPIRGTVAALVNAQTREQLHAIPGWSLESAIALDQAGDVSRPEGWGNDDAPAKEKEPLRFSGKAYDVDEMVTGTFEIHQTKGEVYGKCVQLILSDLISKIEDPHHELAVTIEDAFEALKIALLASR